MKALTDLALALSLLASACLSGAACAQDLESDQAQITSSAAVAIEFREATPAAKTIKSGSKPISHREAFEPTDTVTASPSEQEIAYLTALLDNEKRLMRMQRFSWRFDR